MKKWIVTMLLALNASSLFAAGLTTHMLMVDVAVRYVEDPKLKALIETHLDIVRSGAYFPDTGYINNDQYGEWTHWAPAVRRYMEYLKSPDGEDGFPGKGCDIENLDINSECGQLVAHMLGVAAHGLGDEMWDSLFETQMAARGENNAPATGDLPDELRGLPGLGGGLGTFEDLAGSREYNMDIAVLANFGLLSQQPHTPPAYADVGNVIQRGIILSGRDGFNDEKDFRITETDPLNMIAGYNALTELGDVERSVYQQEQSRVEQAMPWGYQYFYTESGGVIDTAQAMAKHWTSLWERLHGADGPPRVIHTHPANGEANIPVDALQDKSRIEFVLDRQTYFDMSDLADNACLFDENGNKVPARYEYRRHGHYYTILPNQPLQPGHRYTVVLTDAVRDYRAEGLAEPYTWWFTTAPAE